MTTRNQHRDQRLVIATYNVNNVRRRLNNLLNWLADAGPDIVCLQELKCRDNEFPEEAISKAGYQAVWRGERSWNGVAILARNSAPILIRDELPGDPSDRQSRYIEAAISGIVVASIYAPNGNPQPGPKFDYKLAWMERLIAHAAELKAAGVPVILAGDYNVAPADLDIYPARSWDDDVLIQPAPRRSFRRLVDQGWTDAIRHLYPDQRMYSF
jgi:exodeoxyribonuclease-3